MKRAAVFLDRDGVINALVYHRDAGIVDSPFTLSQFRMLPRAARAIRLLDQLALPIVIVSNQPGIAKRHFSRTTLKQCDAKLKRHLAVENACIDWSYYCLHHPHAVLRSLRRQCSCRKPGIGMFLRAARDLDLSLPSSYMVGDGLTDLEAGVRAGCHTIFIGTWKPEYARFLHPPGLVPEFVARDLYGAARIIHADLLQRGYVLPVSSGTHLKPAHSTWL